jgi:hypothetical protein
LRNLAARLLSALLFVMANPAAAILIDDFSVGSFNVQSTGPSVGEMAFDGQACLSFCLSGNRQLQMLSNTSGNVSTAQLIAPPGEAQVVMPAGGGTINYIYQLTGGAVQNITEGGTATQIEVWLTAFEPGTSVGVHLEDDLGASESHNIFPSFPSPPTQLLPGIASIPLANFVTVDLQRVNYFRIAINTQGEAGVNQVSLIQVPGSVAVSFPSLG